MKESKKKKPFIVRLFFIILFIVLLPLMIIGFIFKKIRKCIKYSEWRKTKYTALDFLNQADIEYVDCMQGYEFENFLKVMFFYLGYDALVTKRSGDYGADLVLKKDGKRLVVQAKRYNNSVGVKAVQEVVSAKVHYSADEAMVVTNSRFTAEAEQLASENGVIMLDRLELTSLIREAKEKIEENYKINNNNVNQTELSASFNNQYKFRI